MTHLRVRQLVVAVVVAASWVAALMTRPLIAQGAASRATTPAAASTPTVKVVKPHARSVTGGGCRILSDGTLSGTWGPSALPTLGFTIGPGAAMAEEMHASKAKFTGPGEYTNEIMAVYLGKTALQDSYGGLGTVIVNPDGRTGSFATNDGKAAGSWDCGRMPLR